MPQGDVVCRKTGYVHQLLTDLGGSYGSLPGAKDAVLSQGVRGLVPGDQLGCLQTKATCIMFAERNGYIERYQH